MYSVKGVKVYCLAGPYNLQPTGHKSAARIDIQIEYSVGHTPLTDIFSRYLNTKDNYFFRSIISNLSADNKSLLRHFFSWLGLNNEAIITMHNSFRWLITSIL